MVKWSTANNITRRYLVGVERLAEYSRRGNLPRRIDPDGTVLFDEEIVRCFFRLRRSSVTLPSENLGVLGQSFLNAPEREQAGTRPAPLRSEPVPRGRGVPRVFTLRTGTDGS